MFGKIVFNVLAFTLFIMMFLKFIKRNETSYVYLLILQFVGIAIEFVELITYKNLNVVLKLLMYVFSVIIPIFVFWLEFTKKIDFAEIFYLTSAKFNILVGRDEVAKKYLSQLTEKYPASIKGHKMLGEVYEKQKKYELALEEYEHALENTPEDKAMKLKISELYGYTGKEDEAIGRLMKLLKQQPDYYEASIVLADILNSKKEFKEAVQVYMNALKYRPADYDLYYNLGMTYTLLNDFAKAKECYEKAAQINSVLYHARYSLGQINLLYGDLEEAEKYFMECIEAEEVESGAYYYLARIAMIKGETEKAKNYANIAIEENPTLYDKMADENIFMPIIDEVNKPRLSVDGKKKNKRKTLSKKEMFIDLYLDNTCKIVGKLNNNDIEMMENVKKTKQQTINLDNEIEKE
mgnify:CR=1 FL=1